MKIFIGSSKESLEYAKNIAITVEESGHKPLLWNRLFPPSRYTLESLEDVCNIVDGAIFVFNEDDITWYGNDLIHSVRDNVLLEYGLFIGRLSRESVILCRVGTTKIATDLLGVTYIDYTMPHRANAEIEKWLASIVASSVDAPIDRTKTFKNRTVSIRSLANNKYLGADMDQPNTPIFAHRPISELWEQFKIEITQDGWAAFRACNNGKYISARDDESGTPLFACADTVQDWECFKIFLHHGNHLLKARVNNKYIMADIDRSITPGVVGLYAYVYKAQGWEQFQIKIVE